MEYPDWFEEMWPHYPKRPGNSKMAAYRQCVARLKSGSTVDALYEGTLRYKCYCDHCGFTGTNSVKMARTFYGRDMHFDLEWEIPDATGNRRLSAVERVREANFGNGVATLYDSEALGSHDSDVRGLVATQLRLIGH